MARFRYSARSRAGERVEGAFDAADRAGALRRLQSEGLAPVEILEIPADAKTAPAASGAPRAAAPAAPNRPPPAPPRPSGARRAGGAPRAPGGRRLKPNELSTITREISDLLGAGMTLGRALHTLAQRREDRARARLFEALRDEIVRGASLSESLENRPDLFPPLYASMVRAGEASGHLGETLARLAEHYERVAAARERAVTALAYPLFVLAVGAVTLVFTLIFVVPRFTAIFAELGSALPASTRALIAVSRALARHGWWIALALAGAALAARRALETPSGSRWRDRALLRLPLFRPIVEAAAFGQFARTLGALLANGVPVLRALAIVESTMGNRVIADAVRDARERVTDGASISVPLTAGGLFPPLLTDMLAVGEESGDIVGALDRIARRYDAELDRRVRVLTTLIEPALILLVAVFVGFVAISMLTAVFDLTSGLKTN